MTKRLEQAIARVRELPEDRQNEVAEFLMSVVEHNPDSIRLTPEQQTEVERRLREPPEYLSHEQVRALFEKRIV